MARPTHVSDSPDWMRLVLATVAAVIQLHGPAAQHHPPVHLSYAQTIAAQAAVAWRVSRAVFGQHASTAFCIAGFETGHTYNRWAVSRTDDHGLFQIHAGLETYGRRIYGVVFNATIAYRMSRGGVDWHQWTTHGSCGV